MTSQTNKRTAMGVCMVRICAAVALIVGSSPAASAIDTYWNDVTVGGEIANDVTLSAVPEPSTLLLLLCAAGLLACTRRRR